jgi:hypothetical protein
LLPMRWPVLLYVHRGGLWRVGHHLALHLDRLWVLWHGRVLSMLRRMLGMKLHMLRMRLLMRLLVTSLVALWIPMIWRRGRGHIVVGMLWHPLWLRGACGI